MTRAIRIFQRPQRGGTLMLDAYETFLQDLQRRKGLDLTGYKRPQMERRINSLMRGLKIEDYTEYLDLLQKEINHWRKFLDTLTINVSEFYRNPPQWQVLETKIVPELMQKSSSLKIWSAGCSTGEEPYTLAMVLMQNFPNLNFNITASDIDDEVLNKARAGVYQDKAVANLPKHYHVKYLHQQETTYTVNDEVKKKVRFLKQNLLKDVFDHNYDLILCRNVVIYFTEESKAYLYRRFFESLKPGGVLFTGSTEQIFQAREIGYTLAASFFYKKNQ